MAESAGRVLKQTVSSGDAWQEVPWRVLKQTVSGGDAWQKVPWRGIRSDLCR